VLAALALAAPADAFRPYPFWPQGGILGQDLYLSNTTDLDPRPGVLLDPFCGTRTYDGHTGIDVTIRSFREVTIGVPVFAALDGEVTEAVDDYTDFHFGTDTSPYDNHVIVGSPGDQYTVYGHFRIGILVHRGERVHAGQQLGWTGSSGNSSAPHLHFTSNLDGAISEPFAGPCNPFPAAPLPEPQVPSNAPLPEPEHQVVGPEPGPLKRLIAWAIGTLLALWAFVEFVLGWSNW
jgi:murein DD-endopeptidase MepM/ murein hydrolase activator NlpD